jgi:replicative DNA helicase
MKRPTSDQQSPHSVESERAILGAVLLDNSCWWGTDKLTAEDFYLDSHQTIYRAMATLADEGKPIDFVTLGEELQARGKIESVGGVAYFTSLTDGLPRVKNISQYVESVLDKSKRRKLIAALTAAVQEAHYNGEPVAELISRTDVRLMEIESNTKNDPKHISEVLREADAQMESDMLASGENKASGYTTGVLSLDEMTGGYHRRELTVIGGEPSDGKTALLRQGIVANACMGVPQLVFSREVSRQRLVLDLKAYMSQTNPKHVSDGRKMDIFERLRFKDANKILEHWKLWIDDSRDLHIRDMVHKVRKWARLHDIKLFWLDFVQLVQGDGSNPTQQMEDVCRGTWSLVDSGLAGVVLTQLNRMPGEKKVRPRMRRSKDASKIEQDAHTVNFVYQPEDDDGRRMPHKAEIITAKQRHGPTGIIGVKFNTDTLIFEERP